MAKQNRRDDSFDRGSKSLYGYSDEIGPMNPVQTAPL